MKGDTNRAGLIQTAWNLDLDAALQTKRFGTFVAAAFIFDTSHCHINDTHTYHKGCLIMLDL